MSVFNAIDFNQHSNSQFWQKLDPRSPEDLIQSVVHSGDLRFCLNSSLYKIRRCVLTKSHLYSISKWNLPKYKVQISWKLLTGFIEKENEEESFGFRLGDEIFQDFYTKNESELESWMESLSKVTILSTFEEEIVLVKPIGSGKNSSVFLCQSLETHQEFALKTFQKQELEAKPSLFNQLLNEIKALRSLSHEKLVKLYKIYETDSTVCLLLDYFPSGDLHHWYNKQKKLAESDLVAIVKEILAALNYVHSMGFVHRDIKPENVAVLEKNGQASVKIIDFGLACECTSELFQKCGSPGFIAPEVLSGNGYGFKVDLFSTGALMYKLITGKSLFTGKDSQEIIEANRKALVSFNDPTFKKVQKDTLHMIQALLKAEPQTRCTAAEALEFYFVNRNVEVVHKTSETNPESLNEMHKSDRFVVYKRKQVQLNKCINLL